MYTHIYVCMCVYVNMYVYVCIMCVRFFFACVCVCVVVIAWLSHRCCHCHHPQHRHHHHHHHHQSDNHHHHHHFSHPSSDERIFGRIVTLLSAGAAGFKSAKSAAPGHGAAGIEQGQQAIDIMDTLYLAGLKLAIAIQISLLGVRWECDSISFREVRFILGVASLPYWSPLLFAVVRVI